MEYRILNNVDSPEDLKKISDGDVPALCREIREFLIEKVGKNGGHLASNLGVAELTVALHRVFDSPRDRIIFDVGHQAYVHKMITGRKNRFDELRLPGGLSGFTLMRESEHDAFGAGHSSTALSAALGYATASALCGKDNYTVCVIGDGAYTGGMVHEALNNCRLGLKLIIILNENGMSISNNNGAFAQYFFRAESLAKCDSASKELVHPNYFEDLGLNYEGPVDGNDYESVRAALERAKGSPRISVVHVKTVKGKGYAPAETFPTEFHSIKSDIDEIGAFHNAFVDELIKKAENDTKIVAVTAAMGSGTGLESFGEKFPERYFDVGIAEAHALTFSAGLAAAGYKPYVAIYSTFLQRGYDNVIHDVALQNLPVRIMIDRAGLASTDGATHHGIFDVAFLSHIPNLELYAPASLKALSGLIRHDEARCPIAIRYPNSVEPDFIERDFREMSDGKGPLVRIDFDPTVARELVIITYGGIVSEVIEVKKALAREKIDVGIILVEKLKPYGDACERINDLISAARHVIYVEEGIKNGGAAMITGIHLYESGFASRGATYDIIAIDDDFVAPEHITDIYDYAGLSAKKILEKCKNILGLS